MAKVALRKVSKTYEGGTKAIRDVSFTVGEGQLMVIVGPSGSGKTTLLRLIAGLESATSGAIYIDGAQVNDVPPKDRKVAMVFQDHALYPHMTVFENMALGLKVRKASKGMIRSEVTRTAEQLGLMDVLQRKPKQLSGGQQQRTALGRAIVAKPQIFLFDEPLSDLDAQMRVELRTTIKRLQRSLGVTMIYVTHDQEEAMTLGDQIVVLSEGSVQQHDSPQAVYQHPSNTFVAGFFGRPPMNLISGTLRDSDGLEFTSSECTFSLPDRPNRRSHLNQEVILGFRPEHLRIRSGDALSSNSIGLPSMSVASIEAVGHEAIVHATIGANRITARVQHPASIHPGDSLECAVLDKDLRFFEASTGRTCGSGQEPE